VVLTSLISGTLFPQAFDVLIHPMGRASEAMTPLRHAMTLHRDNDVHSLRLGGAYHLKC
jgi:hypothetical protein